MNPPLAEQLAAYLKSKHGDVKPEEAELPVTTDEKMEAFKTAKAAAETPTPIGLADKMVAYVVARQYEADETE